MSMFTRLYNTIAEGAGRYGFNTWQPLPQDEHADHARVHLEQFLAGDRSEDHLGHALCRIIYAIEGSPDDAVPCGECIYER